MSDLIELPIHDSGVTGFRVFVDEDDIKRLKAFQWYLRETKRLPFEYVVVRRVWTETGFGWELLQNEIMATNKPIEFKDGDIWNFSKKNLIVDGSKALSRRERLFRDIQTQLDRQEHRPGEIGVEELIRDYALN